MNLRLTTIPLLVAFLCLAMMAPTSKTFAYGIGSTIGGHSTPYGRSTAGSYGRAGYGSHGAGVAGGAGGVSHSHAGGAYFGRSAFDLPGFTHVHGFDLSKTGFQRKTAFNEHFFQKKPFEGIQGLRSTSFTSQSEAEKFERRRANADGNNVKSRGDGGHGGPKADFSTQSFGNIGSAARTSALEGPGFSGGAMAGKDKLTTSLFGQESIFASSKSSAYYKDAMGSKFQKSSGASNGRRTDPNGRLEAERYGIRGRNADNRIEAEHYHTQASQDSNNNLSGNSRFGNGNNRSGNNRSRNSRSTTHQTDGADGSDRDDDSTTRNGEKSNSANNSDL